MAGYAISWYENCNFDSSREIDIGVIVGALLIRIAKGKVGRPKGSSVLEKTVKIRLSEAELAAVKEAAGAAGMTLSAFIRSLSSPIAIGPFSRSCMRTCGKSA